MSGTKIRPFAKLIEQSSRPFWVIGPDGRLVFLSAAVGLWLGVDPESLIGRKCVAGASIDDDPMDYLAASLSPPPGFNARGTASLRVQPVIKSGVVVDPETESPAPLDTRFVRLGDASDAITLAVAGAFTDAQQDATTDTATSLRAQLDLWRRHHSLAAATALLGQSRQSVRMRAQTDLARSVRGHLLIRSPQGCMADSVALSVHRSSAADEPIVTIDGSLMDSELLDASLGVAIQHLSDSESYQATALLSALDETPIEAQRRLTHWIDQFGGRMRLIAIATAASQVRIATDDESEQPEHETWSDSDPIPVIDESIFDLLSGLTIRLHALASRVADIPMIATSILDRRRAAGDGNADRFARSALDAMVIYPWPDNLRELDQSIRHALRICPTEVIAREHLPMAVRSYRPGAAPSKDQQVIDLDSQVARFESELIRRTLEAAEGNRAEAARRLNISRARLLRKLDSFDAAGDEESR